MSATILRGDDGSLYFIRDEVLAACKVEGEYLERVNGMIEEQEGEVEGFAFSLQASTPAAAGLQNVAYMRGNLASPEGLGRASTSTIMCPW